MAVVENPQPNPGTGPASEGSKPAGEKLIAGKFKTLEDAVEQGYVGLEKGYHELGEKVTALTRVLEAALTADPNPGPPNAAPDRGGYVDPYGRNPNPQDGRINPADFITDPNKILDEREGKLLEKVGRIVTDVVGNTFAVNEFKSRNPDLVKHEKLVRAYMPDTNPRDSIANRLEEAGKKAREYLASIRAGDNPPGRTPQAGEYVEGPRGPGIYAQVPQTNEAAEKAEEEELAAYITERNADMASHFGVSVKKE